MWGGLTGNRRKNGIYGLLIGVIVGSILLYLSFYISFLYLLIPIVLVVVFHFTKAWRFTDRSFYGLIVIVVAFLVATGGISSSIVNSSHHSVATASVGSTTTNINFAYFDNKGSYSITLSLPSNNLSNKASISLLNLFTNKTISTTNVTMLNSGSNYTLSFNLGNLSKLAYVILLSLSVTNTNKTKNVEFLGPILVPFTAIMQYLIESLVLSYLLITYLFFLAFAFFARAVTTSRRKGPQNIDEQKPPGTGGIIK